MSSPYLTVTAVIAGVTLLQAASGLLLVLLPLRMFAVNFSVQTIGPAVAAAVMDLIGAGGLFVYLGAVSLGFSGYVIHRMGVRPPVPDIDHVQFVDLPATSLSAAELGVTDALSGKGHTR